MSKRERAAVPGEGGLWFGRVPPETVQRQALQPKLKCQSRRRRLSVFRKCRDAAGPQGAPPSHLSGSRHLRLSTRPPRCGWGRGGNGAGALGWVQRLGPVDAPGSGDAVSAPPGCSSKPPRSGGDLSSPWDAPLKPGKRLVWLVPGIKMLLLRVRVLLVTS